MSTGAIRASDPARGALWMVFSCICFATMAGIIRYLATVAEPAISPIEIAFFRNLVSLVIILPWVLRHGLVPPRTTRLGLHLLRATIGLSAMFAWFYAISLMPLATAVAINFTVPLFALVVAIVLLHERVGRHRWGATVVGFAGVIVVLRPGTLDLTLGSALALGSAFGFAMSMTLIRMLARTERPSAIVFYQVLIMTPLSLGPALVLWTTPSWAELGWLVALGALATAAHLGLARGLSIAESSAIAPVDFVRLPFVAAIGYFAFGEIPDTMTWIGAAIIIASTVYIARREARLGRAATLAAQKDDPLRPSG